MPSTPEHPGGRPPSPCISACVLDPRGYCRGCLRTIDEIGRWLGMSASEQRQLLEELARRRAQPDRIK
ncbi:MAG: DUF1289 domain-containing protein [Proteobacteria bacterium]|nr:DUF1289 domain-containing protein [Pseudomonadota bacterium]